MSDKKRFSQNLVALFFGQSTSLLLNFLIFAFLARNLGIEDFGEFSYWIAIIGILGKFIDFGLNPIIFRDYSTKKNATTIYSVIVLRYFALFVLTILFALILQFINTSISPLLILLLLLNIGLSHKYTNIRDILYIPYKVNFKMLNIYFIIIAENILLLIFVLLMPNFEMGLSEFIIAYVGVNLPGTLYLLKCLLENQKYFQIDLVKLKGFLKESIPIYGFVLFSIIYLQVEIILIEFFLDKSSVGLYSAAVRLTRPMELIPSLLITAFFPIIVKNIANNKSNDKVVKSNINLLNFVSISFACLIFFKSDLIVKLVFGNDFINSSQATSFLAISLIFSFLIFYFLDLLTAYGKQKFNLIYIVFVLILNSFLNISLIPKYGIEGAALTKIFSTLMGFIFLLIIVSRNTNVNFSSLFSAIVYLFLLTILIFFISNLNLYLYLSLSTIAIGFSAIISRIIDLNELKNFFNSLAKSKNG